MRQFLSDVIGGLLVLVALPVLVYFIGVAMGLN
jgi:hypothetical protein